MPMTWLIGLDLRHGSLPPRFGTKELLQVLALPFGCEIRDNSLECTKGDSRE